MEHIYAVETKEELLKYQGFVSKIQLQLDSYIEHLKKEYKAIELPRTILWTSTHIATELISDIPIPAYTNDHRIVMTPDLEAWRGIYIKQLIYDMENCKEIRDYYQNALTPNHILQILGHELAHHSELFSDDYQDDIWFEEGMVEYISRRYFLSDSEFEAEAHINRKLLNLFIKHRGTFSLEEFSPATYKNDYAGIFAAYWSSFLAVSKIVKNHNGDIFSVFHSYHRWMESTKEKSLAQWFDVDI